MLHPRWCRRAGSGRRTQVDSDRCGPGIEFNRPDTIFADDNIRLDIVSRFITDHTAGLGLSDWIGAIPASAGVLEYAVARQLCVVTICQAQVLIDNFQGDVQARGIIRQLIQLNGEALAESGWPRQRIGGLNQMEYSLTSSASIS